MLPTMARQGGALGRAKQSFSRAFLLFFSLSERSRPCTETVEPLAALRCLEKHEAKDSKTQAERRTIESQLLVSGRFTAASLELWETFIFLTAQGADACGQCQATVETSEDACEGSS